MATKLVFALSKASDLYPDALSEGGLFAVTLPAHKPPHCSVLSREWVTHSKTAETRRQNLCTWNVFLV